MCRTGRGSISQAERWNVQDGSRRVWIMNSLSLTCLLCTPPPPPPAPFHKTWILKDVIGPAVATIPAEVCRGRWRLTDWYDKPSVFFFCCFFWASTCQTRWALICAITLVFFIQMGNDRTVALFAEDSAWEGEKLRRVVWTWARRRRRGNRLRRPAESTRWRTPLRWQLSSVTKQIRYRNVARQPWALTWARFCSATALKKKNQKHSVQDACCDLLEALDLCREVTEPWQTHLSLSGHEWIIPHEREKQIRVLKNKNMEAHYFN